MVWIIIGKYIVYISLYKFKIFHSKLTTECKKSKVFQSIKTKPHPWCIWHLYAFWMEDDAGWIYLHFEKPICRQGSQSSEKSLSIYFPNPQKRLQPGFQHTKCFCIKKILKNTIEEWRHCAKISSSHANEKMQIVLRRNSFYEMLDRIGLAW